MFAPYRPLLSAVSFRNIVRAQYNDIAAIKHTLSDITDSTVYVDALNRMAYGGVMAVTGQDTTILIKKLSYWQHDMNALSYAITGDFIDKMKGGLQVSGSEGRYLVFTVMLEG